LSAEQAHVLAGLSDQVRITPWRSVVLPASPTAGRRERRAGVARRLALVPGQRACTGRPGCASALADVQPTPAPRH